MPSREEEEEREEEAGEEVEKESYLGRRRPSISNFSQFISLPNSERTLMSGIHQTLTPHIQDGDAHLPLPPPSSPLSPPRRPSNANLIFVLLRHSSSRRRSCEICRPLAAWLAVLRAADVARDGPELEAFHIFRFLCSAFSFVGLTRGSGKRFRRQDGLGK